MSDLYAQLAAGATTPVAGDVDSPPELKFDQPGVEVFGQVTRAQLGISTKFGEGHVLEVTDHQRGPVTVWLSNVQLKTFFVQGSNPLGRPVRVGDVIFARYDSTTPLDGGKTVKNFSVNISPGEGGATPAPQNTPSPAPFPQQQAPAPQPVHPQAPAPFAPAGQVPAPF